MGDQERVATFLKTLVVLMSLAAARAQEMITVCNEANRCTLVPSGRRSSIPSPTDSNSKFVGFGIVTAIAILVAANMIICTVRCIFQRRSSREVRPNPQIRIWSARSVPPVVSAKTSVRQVYVLNPAGSLKLGKKDSRKILSVSGLLGRDNTTSGAVERGIPLVSATSWVAQEEAAEATDRGISQVTGSTGDVEDPAPDLSGQGLSQEQGDSNVSDGQTVQREEAAQEQV